MYILFKCRSTFCFIFSLFMFVRAVCVCMFCSFYLHLFGVHAVWMFTNIQTRMSFVFLDKNGRILSESNIVEQMNTGKKPPEFNVFHGYLKRSRQFARSLGLYCIAPFSGFIRWKDWLISTATATAMINGEKKRKINKKSSPRQCM